MRKMPLTDSAWLTLEGREKPFHVGSMLLFTFPEDADRNYLQDLYAQWLDVKKLHPLYSKRIHMPPGGIGQPGWVEDEEFDIEYHVRHSALPKPGRVRELLALVSRLHGTLLDRSRPMWESHLIEGLRGKRFAMYNKMHHCVVDGVAGMKLVQEALSEDPGKRDMPPPWAAPSSRKKKKVSRQSGPLDELKAVLSTIKTQAGTVPGVSRAIADMYREALRNEHAAAPYRAPMTVLNGRITGARRFSAQSWPIERIRAVGKAFGATLNDVVLGMCGGALREYLLEIGELPDQPLVSMVPVSVRPKDQEGYGNAISMILCSLATDEADPAKRLEAIQDSMKIGKERFAKMSREEIINMMLLTSAPMLFGSLLRFEGRTRPAFNVTISNVPGPKKHLYYNGARMEGIYPVSICTHGQALNITLCSYADNLEFGVIGCRRTLPHLQHILTHLEDTLRDLERAAGIRR